MFHILAAASAALSSTTPVHSLHISHASSDYRAQYRTESTIHLRQVEPRFGNRPAMPVCRWQAELVLNRTVDARGQPIAVAAKPIHRFTPLSGSYAGPCSAARSQIGAEVARYSQARAAEAASVAQQDRAVLVNDLDGIHALSVKGG